jgi:hypothetical protein
MVKCQLNNSNGKMPLQHCNKTTNNKQHQISNVIKQWDTTHSMEPQSSPLPTQQQDHASASIQHDTARHSPAASITINIISKTPRPSNLQGKSPLSSH